MSRQARKETLMGVLASYLSDSDFEHYSHIWQSDYSDQPQFGMVDFLKLLYADIKMPITKGDLVREFNRALHQLKAKEKCNTSTGVEESEAFFKIFEIMYIALTHDFSPDELNTLADSQHRFLKDTSNLKNKNVQQFAAWMRSRTGSFDTYGLDKAVLKQVFSNCYFFCCEAFGPAKADMCLSRALESGTASQYAKYSPPTSLLGE